MWGGLRRIGVHPRRALGGKRAAGALSPGPDNRSPGTRGSVQGRGAQGLQGEAAGATGLPRDPFLARPQCLSAHQSEPSPLGPATSLVFYKTPQMCQPL